MTYQKKERSAICGAAFLAALVCLGMIAGCTSPDGSLEGESPVVPAESGQDVPAPDSLNGSEATALMEIMQRARERKLASEKPGAEGQEIEDQRTDATAAETARRREVFREEYQTYLQLKQLYDSGFVTREELSRGWQDLCRRWNVLAAGQEPAWLLWNPGTGTVQLADSEAQRFIDNTNGTVTDLRTGLVWLRDASAAGEMSWHKAVDFCAGLAGGMLGLSDGSAAGQWRLPGLAELQSLGTNPPATWKDGRPSVAWRMPGPPFVNVRPLNYRAGTSYAHDGDYAWYISMRNGFTRYNLKSRGYFIWPVRGGD